MLTLLSIKRNIQIYYRQSVSLKEQYDINLSLEDIKQIVSSKEGDDLLYLPYELELQQIMRILALTSIPIEVNMEIYFYVLECEGIYDWNIQS